MTVTYTHEVATVRGFGVFAKLLFKWRGSLYKLVWPQLLIYIIFYYSIRFIYKYALPQEQKEIFNQLTLYCRSYNDLIPLSFVLGFYVSTIMSRWWDQYMLIPYPDNLAVFIATSLHGMNDRARLMRRTIMRYVNCSFVMNLCMISPRAKKRFPTLDHLVEAGFLLKNEKQIIDKMNELYSQPKFWMPLVWAGSIVTRARKEAYIKDDFAVKTLLDTINTFRSGLGNLLKYDRINIPLVYTQVVTLAVYAFFISTLISAQFIDSEQDFYVPWFTLLQYFFYMGWLEVAETMVNPFGEDDDDFEVNSLIDRHFQISYLIVDEMHSEHPELIQDKYWDEICPLELPYTVATEHFRTGPHLGSTFNLHIPRHEQYFVKHLPEEDEESYHDEGLSTPGLRRRQINQADEGDGHVKKILRLSSISESKNQDGVAVPLENEDSGSDLWITTPSSSLKKNPSILSQLFHLNNPHRKLSVQRSIPIKKNNSHHSVKSLYTKASFFSRQNSHVDSHPSRINKKDSFEVQQGLREEADDDGALFHISLESLKEAEKEESTTSSKATSRETVIQPKDETEHNDTIL